MTDELRPIARPFVATALDAYLHASSHRELASSIDTAQIVLSLDFAGEMLLKAILVQDRKRTTDKGDHFIGVPLALERAHIEREHATAIELLHQERNRLQHAGQLPDPEHVEALFAEFVEFARYALEERLASTLPKVSAPTESPQEPPTAERVPDHLLSPGDATLQRDVAAEGELIVWAESNPTFHGLRVCARRLNGEQHWLTPFGSYEYLPRTDGQTIATYRQSGGIVIYDEHNRRRVISETGGPGDIQNGFLAAQGVGVAGGLGGGITLFDLDGGGMRAISDSGDSPRLTQDRVVWSEFRDGVNRIYSRELGGSSDDELVTGGVQPDTDNSVLVYVLRHGNLDNVWVLDIESGASLDLGPGFFPTIRGQHVAFLRHRDEAIETVVADLNTGSELICLPSTFPTGGGPALTEDAVLYELRDPSGRVRLARHAIHPTSPD